MHNFPDNINLLDHSILCCSLCHYHFKLILFVHCSYATSIAVTYLRFATLFVNFCYHLHKKRAHMRHTQMNRIRNPNSFHAFNLFLFAFYIPLFLTHCVAHLLISLPLLHLHMTVSENKKRNVALFVIESIAKRFETVFRDI